MKSNQQFDALQNMADHASPDITVHPKLCDDKRKTRPTYFANMGNKTISPVLDYTGMNCFLMGFAQAKGQP